MKNKNLLLGFILSGGLLFASYEGKAQTQTSDSTDVTELSLEDLMNISVTVASKQEEKVSDAPGMITVYTKQDIERFGYYTLKDLANITSGYSSFSAFGETNLETRGQKAGSWNVSKHLLLIDGIPVNHARANSAPLEYQVPLFFADRVEFLKGPGSALYGTSAFYGVMSIKSKELKENGAMAEGKISYGDVLTRRIMANGLIKNNIGQGSVSLSYYKRGFSGDSVGAPKTNPLYDNENSVFMNSSFKFTETKLKGLGIGVIYMRRASHGGEFWGAAPSPATTVEWEELIPYLKYQRQLSNKLSLNSYVKMNSSVEKSTYGASWNTFVPGSIPFSGYDYTTSDVEGLAEVTYDINEKSSLIAGINAYTRKELGSPYSYELNIAAPTDTSVSKNYTFSYVPYKGTARVTVASAYAQYRREFNVLNGLILTAGGRLDNGFSEAGTFNQFSPRVGLVQKLTDKLNIKALYGQALRVPGVKEIGTNAAIIDEIKKNGGTGNPNAIPSAGAEVIKSVEGGINFNTQKISLAGSVFYNITSNALDGAQYSYVDNSNNPLTVNYFTNVDGTIKAKGFELDFQYVMNRNFRLMLNHSYAHAVINDSIDFVDVPTQKTNFATTFTLPGKFKLAATAIVRHVWGFRVSEGAYNDKIVDMKSKSELSGYTFMDLNFQIPVTENLGFEAQIRNVLDTKWLQPSLLGQSSMIPLQRRTLLVTLYTRF